MSVKWTHWVLIFVCLSVVCFYLIFSLNPQNIKLVQLGNELVTKIETYKENHQKLPLSLQDIGIVEKDDYPFYYLINGS